MSLGRPASIPVEGDIAATVECAIHRITAWRDCELGVILSLSEGYCSQVNDFRVMKVWEGISGRVLQGKGWMGSSLAILI